MDHNSPEYREHVRNCYFCKFPLARPTTVSQYRPHTGDSSCWCLAQGNILKTCEVDRIVWRDLPEVEYV